MRMMKLPRNLFELFCVLICLSLLASCSSITSPDMNKPLSKPPAQAKLDIKRSKDLTLILTFSGGGTRAAALSYGVLEALRDSPVRINNKPSRLLDEVDLISSVSGGSFTSAYYGLFGDDIFRSYERRFLKKRVQTELLRLSLFSPKAWIRLAPALFERSDLAAEYYHRTIFRKKTFADMRADAPYIVINATDLSLGRGFAFTDYHFSWICSDLNSFPVGRAVAASSAVPVVFSPIALQNHSNDKGCRYARSRRTAKQSVSLDSREKRLNQTLSIQKYTNQAEKYKYLHLVDGGVSDNLGIRSLLDMVAFNKKDMWQLMKKFKMSNTKQFTFIVVNASSFANPSIPKKQIAPSTVKVIDVVTTIQSNQYNVETIELLRSQFPFWEKQVKRGRCKERPADKYCDKIEFSLIEVNLDDLKAQERQALLFVPTSLELPYGTVDKLKQAGHHLLRRSSGFQKLLKKYR